MNLEEAKDFLEDTLEEDLKLLSPYQRIGIYINLMEFFKAKKQRTAITGNESEMPDDLYKND